MKFENDPIWDSLGRSIYLSIYLSIPIIYISATVPQAQLRVQCKAEGPVFQSSSFPVLQSSSLPDFQIQFQLESESGVGVWRPILENPFLGGCRWAHCVRGRGFLPSRRRPRRLSSPILPRLGAPARHLGTKMPQHLSRYSKKHHLGANIFQHSSQNPPKTASRTLQKRPQLRKKPRKVTEY